MSLFFSIWSFECQRSLRRELESPKACGPRTLFLWMKHLLTGRFGVLTPQSHARLPGRVRKARLPFLHGISLLQAERSSFQLEPTGRPGLTLPRPRDMKELLKGLMFSTGHKAAPASAHRARRNLTVHA